MFEGFAPEGVFYRDTFEKLQGFDLAQKGPPKKQSIKRCKSRDIGKNMFKVKEKSEIKI